MTESMHDDAFAVAMFGPAELGVELAERGLVKLNAWHFGIDSSSVEFERFRNRWNDLEPDGAMADGGSYRLRRYGRLQATPDNDSYVLTPLPHTAFRQENIGMWRVGARVFAPIAEETLLDPFLHDLVVTDLLITSGASRGRPWTVGLHMVRIVARENELGLPTPEGKHRDGHRFVGMHLLRRENCVGGQSSIYRAGERRVQLTLQDPMDSMILDDAGVWHEVSPISPLPGAAAAVRDMLLVDINP